MNIGPIYFPNLHAAPRSNLWLSPFEMTNRRLFLHTDIILYEAVSHALQYIVNLGQVQKAIWDHAHKTMPALPTDIEGEQPLHLALETVLLKAGKEGFP